MMIEASNEGQASLGEALLDSKVKVKVGKRTYRFKPMRKYTNWRISFHLVSQRKVSSDLATNIGLMQTYQIEQAKVLSLALLNGRLAIFLFHAIYWRILLSRLTEQEYNTLMGEIVKRMDVGFFFLNIETVEKINSLTRKLTKTEVQSLSPQEQKQD